LFIVIQGPLQLVLKLSYHFNVLQILNTVCRVAACDNLNFPVCSTLYSFTNTQDPHVPVSAYGGINSHEMKTSPFLWQEKLNFMLLVFKTKTA
jgi:hypothetical protein